ncbi:hypothetical protein D3C81_2265500 [compost metagenome]
MLSRTTVNGFHVEIRRSTANWVVRITMALTDSRMEYNRVPSAKVLVFDRNWETVPLSCE